MFIHKYQPQTIADMVFPDTATENLVKDYASGLRRQHLILHGDYGTGKSQAAKLIGKALVASKLAAFEHYHGSDMSTAADGAQHLKNLTNIARVYSGYPNGWVIIIDEFDRLYANAQDRIGDIMDRRPDTAFILTTNHRDRIATRILARCHQHEVKPMHPQLYLPNAKSIMAQEYVSITDSALLGILTASKGSIRRALIGMEDYCCKERAAMAVSLIMPVSPPVTPSTSTASSQP